MKNLVGEGEECKEAEKWQAVLAAGEEKVGIKEEKEKGRGVVGGVMK
jgi:hypothetical protein